MTSTPADAVAHARAAQPQWASLPILERCRHLVRYRKALIADAGRLTELVATEAGKPPQEALLHELMCLADGLAWMTRRAPRALRERRVPLHLLKHRVSHIQYSPRPVTAVISPFNFPLLIPLSDAGAALLTGSAVVIKPSELTTRCLERAVELWQSTGGDPALLQLVPGDGTAGAALIEAGVDQVLFTGGTVAGRKVAEACARRLIPSVLELGGNAPAIVCADAPLELTARAIVFGACCNAGQSCVSVERVYAHRDIAPALADRLTELASQLRVGPPENTTDVGPLIQPGQATRLEGLVADAVASGAQLRTGGHVLDRPGQFFEPTVLTHCEHEMDVMREECFGPVIPVMAVANETEALRLANDSPVGLASYVFTRNHARGRILARALAAGCVSINDTIFQYATMEAPFGGTKSSGWGRIHGVDALRGLADVKHISAPRLPGVDARWFWYPYGEGKLVWLRRMMHWLFG